MEIAFGIVVVAILVVAAVFSYALHRDLLFPPVILCVTWIPVLMGGIAVSQSNGHTFQVATMLLVGCGILAFTAGCSVVTSSRRLSKLDAVGSAYRPPSMKGMMVVLGGALAILPFYIAKAMQLGEAGPTPFWFMNIRIAIGRGEGYGWTGYGVTIAIMAVVILQTIRVSRGGKIGGKNVTQWFYLALGVATVYAVLATGRTYLLLLGFAVVGPKLVTRSIKVARVVPIFVVIGIVVFAAIATALRKGVTSDLPWVEFVSGVSSSITTYAVGGLFGLDSLLSGGALHAQGLYSTRFFFSVLNGLGFNLPVPSLVLVPITEPIITNVYSAFGIYYSDFGLVGSVIFFLVLGVAYGFMYVSIRVNRISSGSIILYSIGIYPLFMSFFQDQFVTLMSTWIQFVLLWLVCVKLLGRIRFRAINSYSVM